MHITTHICILINVSYGAHKHKPLGTEFKNVVDDMGGLMMWLEIQEGKIRMRNLEYTKELGGST